MTSNLPTPAQNLDDMLRSSGMQKETMVDLLLAERKQANDKYTRDHAEQEATRYLDANEQAVMDMLNKARTSAVVSRETQAAVLKGLIMDFQNGIKRPGLGALTVMKAIELLNKMTGYEKPQEIKHTHDHQIHFFPVSEKPFKGELPPLEVSDLGGESVPYIDTTATPAPPEQTITPEW